MLPDLVFLDIFMGSIDGRDICRELKHADRTHHIPIIMISVHPNAEKSTLDAGADDFIAKPFEMDALLKKVAKYIS